MEKLLIFAIVFGVLVSLAGIYITNFYSNNYTSPDYCQSNFDCVPAQCCHPTSCINTANKPNCEGIFCTQVCQGPIDCGAGYCGCVNNKCQVIPR